MTIGAAQISMPAETDAAERVPRELAALASAAEWINTPRLTAVDLLGKVVLVDFCTYTCINWLRTLPYVRAWAQKYRQGLVDGRRAHARVRVRAERRECTPCHAAIEGRVSNRDRQRLLHLACVQEPVLASTVFPRSARPHSSPSFRRGRVRKHRSGPFNGCCRRPACPVSATISSQSDGGGIEAAADWTNLRSPETYLGYERSANFVSRVAAVLDQRRAYTAPARMALNEWALAGDWTMGRHAAALNKPGGQIVYRFHARDVHLVMGPSRPGKLDPVSRDDRRAAAWSCSRRRRQ